MWVSLNSFWRYVFFVVWLCSLSSNVSDLYFLFSVWVNLCSNFYLGGAMILAVSKPQISLFLRLCSRYFLPLLYLSSSPKFPQTDWLNVILEFAYRWWCDCLVHVKQLWCSSSVIRQGFVFLFWCFCIIAWHGKIFVCVMHFWVSSTLVCFLV